MPHELLLRKLEELKALIEKERDITAKDSWSHMLKMRAQERLDNAIIAMHEAITQ